MTKYTNETVPLILSLVGCFLFAIGIIVAGYIHGNILNHYSEECILNFLLVTLWVQVPQWNDDWTMRRSS